VLLSKVHPEYTYAASAALLLAIQANYSTSTDHQPVVITCVDRDV
jgi:hypothetical protein